MILLLWSCEGVIFKVGLSLLLFMGLPTQCDGTVSMGVFKGDMLDCFVVCCNIV